jgi:general stress protein 26
VILVTAYSSREKDNGTEAIMMNHTATSSESSKRMYDFIKHHPVGVLATVNPDDTPHATVIYFTIHNDFSITFVTKSDTKKHSNLQRSSQAMAVVYEPLSQTAVQITGNALEMLRTRDREAAFKNMMNSSMQTSDTGIPPLFKLEAGLFVAYRLKPSRITLAVFARPDPGTYETLYEELNFS